MSTTNKYKIETRTQHSAGWTTDGMGLTCDGRTIGRPPLMLK